MLIKNYKCILNFFIDTKNIEKVLKELKKLENLYNIKKLDVSLIESSEEKIKEECYINNIKYDDTIKILDCEGDNEKEKDLLTFITNEQYGEFLSETISDIEEIIQKFEDEC